MHAIHLAIAVRMPGMCVYFACCAVYYTWSAARAAPDGAGVRGAAGGEGDSAGVRGAVCGVVWFDLGGPGGRGQSVSKVDM